MTGIVLSAGKIVAEAAALIFTLGSNNPANVYTLDPRISSDTLTIHIYFLKMISGGSVPTPVADAVSSGSAALLVILLLIINVGSRAVARFIERRVTAA